MPIAARDGAANSPTTIRRHRKPVGHPSSSDPSTHLHLCRPTCRCPLLASAAIHRRPEMLARATTTSHPLLPRSCRGRDAARWSPQAVGHHRPLFTIARCRPPPSSSFVGCHSATKHHPNWPLLPIGLKDPGRTPSSPRQNPTTGHLPLLCDLRHPAMAATSISPKLIGHPSSSITDWPEIHAHFLHPSTTIFFFLPKPYRHHLHQATGHHLHPPSPPSASIAGMSAIAPKLVRPSSSQSDMI